MSDLTVLTTLSKVIILVLHLLVALVALGLSARLARLTTPLAMKLAELHQNGSTAIELGYPFRGRDTPLRQF